MKLHDRTLTWNLKITCLKRNIIFQTSTFGFHVSFQGSTSGWTNKNHSPTWIPLRLSTVRLVGAERFLKYFAQRIVVGFWKDNMPSGNNLAIIISVITPSHYHPWLPCDSVELGFYWKFLWTFINLNLFPAFHLHPGSWLSLSFPTSIVSKSTTSKMGRIWNPKEQLPHVTPTRNAWNQCFFSKFCNIVEILQKNTKKEKRRVSQSQVILFSVIPL